MKHHTRDYLLGIGVRLCLILLILPAIVGLTLALGGSAGGAMIAMPASAAIVNTTLTNYAQGFAQDLRGGVADVIAPIVRTGIAHGQYKEYSDKNAFQNPDTARAIGGNRNRIEFGADDPYFNCAPQGLETGIDDHERELAGDAGVLNLQQAKLATLITAANVSHENKVWTTIKAGLSAVGSRGVWSSDSNDPVEEIDEQIESIAIETGMMPNRIVFGIGAWRVFRNHPKVIARQPGAALIGLTTAQASSMLLEPGLEIHVATMSKDTTKFGKAKSAANIVGAEVFIFYASQAPSQYDPSFAKTFSVTGSMVGNVKEYREERANSDIYALDWSEEIKVTAAASGRRLTLS